MPGASGAVRTTSSHATDSETTDQDVIVRYEGEEVIGMIILHASQR